MSKPIDAVDLTSRASRPLGGDGQDRAFLAVIGNRVRSARRASGLSRKAVSERSGVSQRYLAQLEGGTGNISILLLKKVADAIHVPLEQLVSFGHADAPDRDRAHRFAMIGLRGAGKSTLGKRAADQLDLPFVELNAEIRSESGLAIAEIFALYGEDGYRRLERECLEKVATEYDRVVLAVGGGIVSEPDTFNLLLNRFTALWLRAAPEEHMERVRRQGDERPMAGNPAAMDLLKQILKDREELYAKAPFSVETSGRHVDESAGEVAALISRLMNG